MIQPISDEDFRRLTSFIKSEYGITLQEKRQLVTSRLSSLLTEQGYSSFSQFVTQLLKEKDPQKIEQVLNRLTTNYTFFMRETEHFDFFSKVILPELVRKYQSKRSIAIWSAGCSSGEEPYNLSMYIKDYLGMQAISGTPAFWPPISPRRRWPPPKRASTSCPTPCPRPGARSISKKSRAAGTPSPPRSAAT